MKLQIAVQALTDITNPIEAMKRNLPEGYELDDPTAVQIADNPQWYKRTAEEALHKIKTEAGVEVTNHGEAKAYMEHHLSQFIALAGSFPEVKLAPEIWSHVRCYMPSEFGIDDNLTEAAYWTYDARVKGYSEFKICPQTERDAFKTEARKLIYQAQIQATLHFDTILHDLLYLFDDQKLTREAIKSLMANYQKESIAGSQ